MAQKDCVCVCMITFRSQGSYSLVLTVGIEYRHTLEWYQWNSMNIAGRRDNSDDTNIMHKFTPLSILHRGKENTVVVYECVLI